MELEELQGAWTQMSKELETQKKLTNSIIMEMTRTKYKNKFAKIRTYEKLGTLVCFGVAVFILVNFGKLDTWYLQVCGVLCLAFLIIMPVMVLSALKQIQNLDIFKGTYTENLVRYTKSKTRLLRLQQVAIVLSFAMMFFIVPTTSKIFNNKDVFLLPLKLGQWIGLFISFVGALIFSRWGYKSYQKITKSAELLLNDLK